MVERCSRGEWSFDDGPPRFQKCAKAAVAEAHYGPICADHVSFWTYHDVIRLIDPEEFFRAWFSANAKPDIRVREIVQVQRVPDPGWVVAIGLAGFAAAQFDDGMIVDPFSCPDPEAWLVREHWRLDGSCRFPDELK